MKINRENYKMIFVVSGCIFYVLLSMIFRDIPFFWDSVIQSENAYYFFENNFSSLILPASSDNGHPPLFALYLAGWWSLFGKTLLVSHIAMLPFAFLLVNSIINFIWKRKGLGASLAALIILMAEPTITSQFLFLSPDFALAALFSGALYSLFDKKYTLLFISLIGISLLSIRGLPLVAAFFLTSLIIHKKDYKINILVFLAALVPVAIWFLFHHEQTGWYFSDPGRQEHRALADVHQILRNAGYVIWKILDSGRIVLFAALIILLYFSRKPQPESYRFKSVFLILFLSLLLSTIIITNPVSHRYYMPLIITAILFTPILLEKFHFRFRNAALIVIVISLISGNFWTYPQKLGNGWDSTLKTLSYFKSEQKALNFIHSQKIPSDSIASAFPFMLNSRFSYLEEPGNGFQDKDEKGIQGYPWIVYSNVCNAFTEEEIKLLKEHFSVAASFSQCGTEVIIYRHLGNRE